MASVDYNSDPEQESEDMNLQGFICPICLEIYNSPIEINCGNNHIYCNSCLRSYQHESKETKCPECRGVFDINATKHVSKLERQMRLATATCKWCKVNMTVHKLRSHLQKCSQQNTKILHFKPIKETTQPIPSNLPNRSTFNCPLCGSQNFDCKGLIKHCNEQHVTDMSSVVCPVCASMPWGERDMKSSNFLQHLNLRHKFEYDTYVDFGQDDDEMLRAAIAASLEEN